MEGSAEPGLARDGDATWNEQRDAVCATAADGLQWGTITSEPGSGGDVARTKTLAVADGECYPTARGASERALAEPVSCALNAVQLANPAAGDAIVVFGAGFLGSLVQLLARLRGPRQSGSKSRELTSGSRAPCPSEEICI